MAEAERLFLSLIQQVSGSPDLTQKHRFQIMQIYTGHFEKQIELFQQTKRGLRKKNGSATRGPFDGLDAPSVISKFAFVTGQRGLSTIAEQGLLDISKNLDEVLGGQKPEAILTNDDMNGQLEQLEKISRIQDFDPGGFAEAITTNMFHPG